MLTIRKEQMAVLTAHMRESYVRKTLENLARVFPDDPQAQDENAMRALIQQGIQRAGAYGITGERETSLYIFLLKDLGPHFERRKENRWMEDILSDQSLEEDAKMGLIYRRLELAAGRK